MGPKGFEKQFIKACGDVFNETKILFFHEGRQTLVKYPYNDRLYGIRISRDDYEIKLWVNHFVDYLKTGKFDNCSYWRIYDVEAGSHGPRDTRKIIYYDDHPKGIPMILKDDNIWSVHSPEHNEHMKFIRAQEGMAGVGFQRFPKPTEE